MNNPTIQPIASAENHGAASEELSIPKLDRDADLQTVLGAWHAATLRLERTHETLRAEVERLRDELEVKNRELARKNRLVDLGRMAAHVAHEVRNSLVPVNLYLSLLRRRLKSDHGSLEVLGKVEGSVNAVDTTVNDLLHFTSDREPLREQVLLKPFVEELLNALIPQFEAQGITPVMEVPEQLATFVDKGMLRRAMLNLILNAIDAMRQGGEMRITARTVATGWEIDVSDRGQGLNEDALRRAFEPFFTTKSNGTGLGLAIVERMAEAHGGRISASNRAGGGAVMTLHIPYHLQKASA